MNKVSVGIIGLGNMGSAIAERLKDSYKIYVFDKENYKTERLNGVDVCSKLSELTSKSQVIIIAVKPQDFDIVLKDPGFISKDKLIVSIAAGIKLKHIENILSGARVIRTMPNIGARICESMTCLTKGKYASDADLELTKNLFGYLGQVMALEEDMINAATAISGSGPAYIADFLSKHANVNLLSELELKNIIAHLKEAALEVGFSDKEAQILASFTTRATLELLKQFSIVELINSVASKGGTTEAALKVIANGGTWIDAAKAALKRAEELSKKE